LFTQSYVPHTDNRIQKQQETFPPARGSFIFLSTVQRNVEPIHLAHWHQL